MLVAEDNLVNQKVISNLLSRWNCQFEIVGNGKDAVEALRKSEFDIVLMDVQMPLMDGLEATSIMRKEGRKLPILAMTAHAMEGDHEKCIQAGMDDYIAKPVKSPVLHEMIQRWVSAPGARSLSPQSESATQDPVLFDPEALEASSLGDPGVEGEIIAAFLHDARQAISAISNAIQTCDAPELRSAAHGLKGSSLVVGAQSMSLLCLDLEKMGSSGELESAPLIFSRLQTEHARLSQVLRARARRAA